MRRSSAVLLLFFCLSIGSAYALINPNFTPVDLYKQSEVVLILEIGKPDATGKAIAKVKETLKGKYAHDAIEIGFLAGALRDHGKAFLDMVQGGGVEAILFIGYFEDEKGNTEEARGYLNVKGKWASLLHFQNAIWDFNSQSAALTATWNGGTDMLIRAARYIKSDEDAKMPSEVGVNWGTAQRLGLVEGVAGPPSLVPLTESGDLTLFVPCMGGDLLYELSNGAIKEGAQERQLMSKSKIAAWYDINLDGRTDLLSYNGTALELWVQSNTGVFAQGGEPIKLLSCYSIHKRTLGAPGMVQLIIAGADGLSLLGIREGKIGMLEVIPSGVDAPEGLSSAVIADLDDDGISDAIQFGLNASVFYKGNATGGFTAGRLIEIAPGAGAPDIATCLGDYDADGLLDVVTVSAGKVEIWQGKGNGSFAAKFEESGEISYKAKANGVAVSNCDLNNDGRQDLVLFFRDIGPQFYFNRGFRSFGYANTLDFGILDVLQEALKGQLGGCIGDLNKDGTMDLCLLLHNGEVWFVPLTATEDNSMGASIRISSAKTALSPLKITGFSYGRCLGAWNLSEGGQPVFFGTREAGPLKLTWRLPSGEAREKNVIVEDGTITVFLD